MAVCATEGCEQEEGTVCILHACPGRPDDDPIKLPTVVAELKTQIATLEGRVETTETRSAELETRVGAVETKQP